LLLVATGDDHCALVSSGFPPRRSLGGRLAPPAKFALGPAVPTERGTVGPALLRRCGSTALSVITRCIGKSNGYPAWLWNSPHHRLSQDKAQTVLAVVDGGACFLSWRPGNSSEGNRSVVRQFSLFPAILPQCFEVVGSSFSEVGLQLDERQGSRLCAVPWHQACDPLVSIETPASGGRAYSEGR